RRSVRRRAVALELRPDPRARPGYRMPQTQIVDLAPTLLHLMGLPIPANMDGAVIQAAFRPGWWQAHPPQTVPADDALPPDDDSTGLSPQEEAAMLQMLKDLGYVE
ncbi:MAG: hypothetical protein ACE5G8_16540, partial [Anaerolineae bacterium]